MRDRLSAGSTGVTIYCITVKCSNAVKDGHTIGLGLLLLGIFPRARGRHHWVDFERTGPTQPWSATADADGGGVDGGGGVAGGGGGGGGVGRSGEPNAYRRPIVAINEHLRAFAAAQPAISYLDCGARFLTPAAQVHGANAADGAAGQPADAAAEVSAGAEVAAAGPAARLLGGEVGAVVVSPIVGAEGGRLATVIEQRVMADFLHLSTLGYERWAACLGPVLAAMLEATPQS